MDEHELLLRHTESWAKTKKRPLDRELLETVIGLRTFHDVRAAQEWPLGSVEHVMLVRWPSHGPAEVPDVDALIETLDTFWRFLRGTGRMRSGSAEPKDLVKEARRAGPGMREACADSERHSPTKSLVRFAAESGMPLDEAGSPEELNARMQQVMEAFNALPFEERGRWLPGPGAPGNVPTQRASDMLRQVFGDSRLDADESPFDDDLDDEFDAFEEGSFDEMTWDLVPDPDSLEPEPDPEVTARDVQSAPFVLQCLRLARWVGEGRPVTATGVLRLAPAREAYAELGLWEWELGNRLRSQFAAVGLPDDAASQQRILEEQMADLRSARDVAPLDRLWDACQTAGLIEVGKSAARATRRSDADHPRDVLDWVSLGLATSSSVVANLDSWVRVDPLLRVLFPLLRVGVDHVTLDAVKDWWWTHPDNFYGNFPAEVEVHMRQMCDGKVEQLLWLFDDVGVWQREGELLHRTALGMEVAMMLFQAMDKGTLQP